VRFLLIFLVVLVVAWRWRVWRESRPRKTHSNKASASKSIGMVACHHCGMHVPTHDAIPGALGHYCSLAHRQHCEP
jgi:uncharacterized protein